ncbi:MAG: DUF1489 domain-containing protein, partial [Sphingopyxis sp.]
VSFGRLGVGAGWHRTPSAQLKLKMDIPLHLTKIAFGCDSLAYLSERLAMRGDEVRLTTRNKPRRAEEIMAGGSLYWILASRLVARSPILRFEPSADGRTDIVIAAVAIPVMPVPRRVHQGWRYLEGADAPRDLADLGGDAADMPHALRDELGDLGLI